MRHFSLFLLFVSLATVASAQQNQIGFTPAQCWKAGEMAALPLSVAVEGDLRAFFRHVGAADWCSVDGVNRGPVSNVTMPKFVVNDEIEYFFVVAQGKKVVAKSTEIYRVKITEGCESPYARHTIMVIVNCTPAGSAAIGSAVASGLSIFTSTSPASPDRPIASTSGH